ncbi:MAG: HupE / UreJ protein, partial [Marinilabiliales bacterium]
TAFTLGHSVTLALASLQILIFPTDIIEFLIPLTIFITAIGNILYKGENMSKRMHNLKYVLAMFFGLIHGLGFSNYLRSLLGMEGNLVKPLFAFNIGLEIGQITIVMCILLMSFLFHRVMNTKHREWNLVISGAAAGISFILMLERWPW